MYHLITVHKVAHNLPYPSLRKSEVSLIEQFHFASSVLALPWCGSPLLIVISSRTGHHGWQKISYIYIYLSTVFILLCKPGREQRWLNACMTHLQSGWVCGSVTDYSWDCCSPNSRKAIVVRLLWDWLPVSGLGWRRSRQHPLFIEYGTAKRICVFMSVSKTPSSLQQLWKKSLD